MYNVDLLQVIGSILAVVPAAGESIFLNDIVISNSPANENTALFDISWYLVL